MTNKASFHTHPRPTTHRVQQYVALALLIVIALKSILFLLAVVMLVLLAAPVMMLLTVSPPVTVSDAGLELQPLVGKKRLVPWADVVGMKDYTLLPTTEQEFDRRMIQGRKKYRPVEGKMLIIRDLPPQYRIAGFFAGEKSQPIIALTSRTHTEYDRLIQRITGYMKRAPTDMLAENAGQ